MAREINFGLWYDFRNPAGANGSYEKFYRGTLDQIVHAETLGFDSVWLTEHHFCDDGYTPSPLVIAAAIGARTARMRIGTNLVLLPIADPVRLAEEAATLSILTEGRFDLGVGLGYREIEFDHFGRKLSHRPSLMEEGVEIIRQAWTGDPVQFEGKRHRVDGVRITPVPTSPPRLLMGGMSEPAIRRAARLGDGFLSTGGIGHDIYHSEIEKLADGEASNRQAQIFAGHWAIIAEDPEAELASVGQHVLYQINEYVKWGAFGSPDEVPLFPDPEAAVRDGLYELWTAEVAVRELTALLQNNPSIQDLHFWAQFPGESLESGTARMNYIAENVLPQVRRELDR